MAADPILHIKDSYYFEVPKALWPAHYGSLEELPPHLGFLKQEAIEQHATIADVNKELTGKIVIPQPFGRLKSFYAKESGFAISKFMVIEVVIAALLVFIFSRLAGKVATGKSPKGYGWNLFESMLVFIRDGIARPAIDSHDEHDHSHHTPHDQGQEEFGVGHIHGEVQKHDGDRFLPILWTMFFFILFCNLFGMLPWLGAPSGSFSVTFALACCTLATTIGAGIIKFGPVGFWKNQVPSMDLPGPLAIVLKPMIFVIEFASLLIKHAILSVRLLANMVAGHLVLLAILGLIVATAEANSSTGTYATVAGISIVGSTLLSLLELFVAFLQAYVFTFLAALFFGAATHQH